MHRVRAAGLFDLLREQSGARCNHWCAVERTCSARLRVNSVNPGATLSEGTKTAGLYGVGSDIEKQLVAMTPLGRMGTAEDIAKVVAFLASDDSAWLTGEVILASGGLR